MFVCEHARGSAVAAADVADAFAVFDGGFFYDEIDKLAGRQFRTFAARQPETVVNVLTPNFAVETIKFVVMKRNCIAVDLDF